MSADLILYLDLDQPQPSLRRTRSLVERLPVALDPLTAGATLSLEIRPHRSGVVDVATTDVLNTIRLILKVLGPTGIIELARLNPADFTAIVESSIRTGWSAKLPLTSTALRSYFADNADTKLANFELTLITSLGEYKPLYLVSAVVLSGYITALAAASNTAPIVMASVTTHAQMRALSTSGLTTPILYLFLIAGNWEAWTLRTKAATGEDDDDTSFIAPTDFNVSTNNVTFVKSTLA